LGVQSLKNDVVPWNVERRLPFGWAMMVNVDIVVGEDNEDDLDLGR
jgi:hypothetical protein